MIVGEQGQTRGIVLLESLSSDMDHSNLLQYEVLRYPYLLDGVKPTTVVKLALPISKTATLLLDLSRMLQEKGFYAHFIHRNSLFVVFPRCVVQADRHSPKLFDQCRAIGVLFSIPIHQMKFERLFKEDHPKDI